MKLKNMTSFVIFIFHFLRKGFFYEQRKFFTDANKSSCEFEKVRKARKIY